MFVDMAKILIVFNRDELKNRLKKKHSDSNKMFLFSEICYLTSMNDSSDDR